MAASLGIFPLVLQYKAFLKKQKRSSEQVIFLIIPKNDKKAPEDTRRRFDVFSTMPTWYRRLIDFETTSCVYWILA